MRNLLLGLLLTAGAMSGGNTTWAATTGVSPTVGGSGTPSSTSTFFQTVRKNIRGSYINEFTGPSIRTLSGNTGDGTKLQMIHYFGLSYVLGSKWRIALTQPIYQRIDNKPASEVDPFEPSDPYITFHNTRVLGSTRHGTNLYLYARYYFPVSKGTINTANSYGDTDKGNGQIRFTAIPSISMMGGALNLTGATFVQYRIAKQSSHDRAAAKSGDPHRKDMIFVFDPILTYTVSDLLEVYLEYAFDMEHSTNGHWSSYKKADYVSPGVNLQLTKKLMVNPYLLWEPRIKELKNTGIGVTAIYAFL